MRNKAIFLDRDGVIIDNQLHYYIWKREQLKFVEGIFENLTMLQNKGFQLFIVSNQGGISRGLYSKTDILKFHEELVHTFVKNQITISDILFCPHHNDNEKCLCRKPESLMIDRLIYKYNLDPGGSFMIGDSESDMTAATLAGVQGIRITSNQNMFPFISTLIR